jgi:hypothetical protein
VEYNASLVVHKAAEYARARRTAIDARIQQQGQEGPSAPQEGLDDQEQLTLEARRSEKAKVSEEALLTRSSKAKKPMNA